jgi:mRNA-degrading endonuclease RelE of RelBE toxin-antitoxin system
LQLSPTPRFTRAYKALPQEAKDSVQKAIRQFMENPRHPGLHFEKLKGSAYRTIRPDRGKYRIVLRGDGTSFELVDVDRHDIVDRRYG